MTVCRAIARKLDLFDYAEEQADGGS